VEEKIKDIFLYFDKAQRVLVDCENAINATKNSVQRETLLAQRRSLYDEYRKAKTKCDVVIKIRSTADNIMGEIAPKQRVRDKVVER